MTSAEAGTERPLLDRRARWLLPIFLVLLVVATIHRYLQAPVPTPDVYVMRGAAMGTRWSVKIADAKLTPEQEQAIANSIATRLGRIESLMSTWDSSSEISRFNLHAPNEMFEISRELRQVFEISRVVHQLSDGAFDVTVGPLVGLWGFGSGARREEEGVRRLPSGSELEATRARVGLAKVGLDPVGQLYKTLEGVELDFSGIAKGYAVDRVAEGLLELGYRAFLFELGGELRGHGGHRDGSSWRVAIEVPRSAGRATTGTSTSAAASVSRTPSIPEAGAPWNTPSRPSLWSTRTQPGPMPLPPRSMCLGPRRGWRWLAPRASGPISWLVRGRISRSP
jgi:thiamine biosynthesis lipoprotein ApbE